MIIFQFIKRLEGLGFRGADGRSSRVLIKTLRKKYVLNVLSLDLKKLITCLLCIKSFDFFDEVSLQSFDKNYAV